MPEVPVQDSTYPPFCAVILAGGKSSRLNHTPKAGLSDGTCTLLDCALDAARQARMRVVVGPETLPLPPQVLQTRENPPYAGPAAAIHAGLEKLASAVASPGQDPAPWCLILGVDTPRVAPAVEKLLDHAAHAPENAAGYWGIADGITQPLVGIYRFRQVREAFAQDTANASVRSFLKRLQPVAVELDPVQTADIDTWEQAHKLGYDTPQWLQS